MITTKNHVQLIGFLGSDPEVKKFDNGRMMAKFSLATNETFTAKNGEKVTQTEWHQVIAWGPLAEISQNRLHKGAKVTVIGRLTWYTTTDTDGHKYPQANVQAGELHLMAAGEQK